MNAKQHKLYAAVLAQIPHGGWTDRAFAAGGKSCGLSVKQARVLFPGGIDDIAAAFYRMIDDAMHASIKSERRFAAMRVRDKIAFAVRARLEAMQPHRDAVRRLLVRSLLPRHIAASAGHMWQVADLIWVAAGDASTDYNYYTKRGLLIGVMKATVAFWLNDDSDGCRETWAFLDRRIENVMTLGKGIGVVKTVGLADIVSFLRARLAA